MSQLWDTKKVLWETYTGGTPSPSEWTREFTTSESSHLIPIPQDKKQILDDQIIQPPAPFTNTTSLRILWSSIVKNSSAQSLAFVSASTLSIHFFLSSKRIK
jgi:hypothetical protein